MTAVFIMVEYLVSSIFGSVSVAVLAGEITERVDCTEGGLDRDVLRLVKNAYSLYI